MTKLSECFGFNLANTFTGNVKLFAHFLQRAGAAILQTKTQTQHLFLTRGQALQHTGQLLFEQSVAGSLCGYGGILIGNEVAKVAVLLLTDGRFQADRLLGNTHNLAHLIYRHIQLERNFICGRLMAVFVQKLAGNFLYLIDGFHHMHRDTDGAGLVGNGTGDCLTNPPCCIGGKFKALRVVKLLHRFD